MSKLLFLLPAAMLCALVVALASFKPRHSRQKPVVIELFTSEGCSSCPPAGLLLQQTVSDAMLNHQPVYAMEFHVDYWNRLGWIDSFSNRSFSERQENYETVLNTRGAYTPQMIVNGSHEFVGSDGRALREAILEESGKVTNTGIDELRAVYNNGKINVSYKLFGNTTGCNLEIALVSNQVQTSVKCGENHGRTLTHTHVVRRFITLPANTGGVATLNWPGNYNVQVIAFLQNKASWVMMDAASAAVK